MDPETVDTVAAEYTPPAEPELQTTKFTFGDIEVEASKSDLITPEQMLNFEDNFEVFTEVIGSTEDPQEKSFSSSPGVFACVMGLDPVSDFEPEEARLLFKSLRKTDNLDRFGIVNNKDGFPVFINIRSAEELIKVNSDYLRTEVPDTPMTKDQVVDKVIELHNNSDANEATRAAGILSGFPNSAVESFIQQNPNSHGENLSRLDNQNWEYLMRNEEFRISRRLGTAEKTFEIVYMRDYFKQNKIVGHKNGDKIGIEGLGVAFATEFPPTSTEIEWCQKAIELDKKLGVTEYVSQVRSDIRLELKAAKDVIEGLELLN